MVGSIRLGGLISGLDTNTIVSDLMKVRRAPLNQLLQRKQTEEWRRDQFREMNSLLLDLKNKTFDMRMQGTFQKKAVASDSEAIVSAKQKGTPTLSTYNVEVTALSDPAKAASVKFVNTLANDTTEIGEAFDFKIGTTTINVTATDTISSVLSKVNAVSSTTGVTASYLKDDKSITFTTTATGANAAISIDVVAPATTFGASNKLNLSVGTIDSTGETFATDAGFQLSKDATAGSVKINGIAYSVTSSTFNFDGVEFNIKALGTTKVNVKPDEDAVFNSIKGFIDKYNEVIEKINAEIRETKYRDYKPLLDEEKEALSEKQIEQWEDKAKSGLLRQDPLLSNALAEMRRVFSTNVTAAGMDPNFDALSEIGITTGNYMERGKLHINETKLREAISQNGTKVMDLFTKASTSTDPTTKFNESGLAQRLYDQLNISMSKITDKAGSSLYLADNSLIGKDLRRIDTDISRWESRLQDIEDRYWKSFSAMETAMNRAQSQSGWLAQQF
ncbi:MULTISPECIES: flagellar filament capping protein FliD [unclassified Paenibacillus]|uniref:flagellar filament capping protein FliD n=1 Tax=unclassified Paenibacillus TaxID=185978 RepID=UPI001AE62C81|nr:MULTISPECIES: flagellar filament capping protein FliD [unclassified Paenibacillus]MBP1157791.1 flagellar hook-associated protein 2 [Paenibacillus sp. PvP091]MBP1171473.1 flagellar hook-associated protein 2 [Paenibacillus sp. PvR098]MBP2442501.1 flagellar hook-associated protein 2 [Paenibacillus sp. PvP052]